MAAWLLLAAVALACRGEDATGPDIGSELSKVCTIEQSELVDGGVGFGGIPALTDPELSNVGGPGLGFLHDTTRVVGLEVGGEALAVPLNILWYHEIVNFDMEGGQIAVTQCPLTGSALVFGREPVGGREFVVSGLLWRNNLILTTDERDNSLFMQMAREAKCGPDRGTRLPTLPFVEVRFDTWKRLHPDTKIVNANTGFDRDYGAYPLGNYRNLDNRTTLFGVPFLDPRRPPKERLLGIPDGTGGLAFPFLELKMAGPTVAARERVSGEDVVVFWRSEARGAGAYRPVVTGLPEGDPRNGEALSFTVRGDTIADEQTGSAWSLEGRAVSGPLEGAHLPFVESYTAFWFAWAIFQPDTRIWIRPDSAGA